MKFNTTRLNLRPVRAEDVGVIHDLWTNDHVRRFLFDDRSLSLEETRSYIEASSASFEARGYGLWLVFLRETEALAGFAGLLSSTTGAPNLIYGIDPDLCGNGYATEAAAAVLRYATETLGLGLVKADVDEPNVDSIRVLEKLGMKQVNRAMVEGRWLLYYEIRTRKISQKNY